ncbi:hypothetical protein EXU57_19250 [Segetibacter sp. 3557_3]|uniref:sulfatase-like hydrolase/transferase n=1 Tax=Segetibacter sp. 3557_3 TaxID=2547429 RepID=UPI0010586691|nr:sulfatase-like hydrolase/transferase [Segetibacter sp. 3557_3]TDH21640.1 hypothetical protein EXU57_19250 [Segetibacter sp. 3557_3]
MIDVILEGRNERPMLVVFAYAAAFCSIITMMLNRNIWVKKFAEVLVFSAIYTDLLYLMLSGYPFSYPDAINLFNNPEYASAAFATFKIPFLLAFVGTGIAFALLQFSLKPVQRRFAPGWLMLFLVIQGILYLSSARAAGWPDLMPAVYRVSGNLLTSNIVRPETRWRRDKVRAIPLGNKVDHVFIIVDESVTATALSINGSRFSTTPFLQANTNRLINFGVATSFTNFSAGSNLSLMAGMQMRELPDTGYEAFAKPGIFRYARQAGYQTYLLDAQTPGDKLQNYTTSQDLAFIDSIYKPSHSEDVPLFHRDSLIAEKIAAIASLNVPTFTYVNKFGAHWPYNTNYPPTALAKTFSSVEQKRETAKHYFRSLQWNVDQFWHTLMNRLPANSKLLILYTADHGEHFNAKPLNIKHASIYRANSIEGLVPLLAVDRAGFFPPGYAPERDRYSHEYIFPTLLVAMGYDPGFVAAQYGRTLLQPACEKPRWFQTGDLFGRGTNKRVVVDTGRLRHP